MENLELVKGLAVALVIGLLVGIERGWQQRGLPEGARVAGVRTFALVGLLGGMLGALSTVVGDYLLAFGFLAFALLVVVAHWVRCRDTEDIGVTTEVAQLLTLILAMLALRLDREIAAAGAVVVVALLSGKERLHDFLRRVEELELVAAIKLLVISVVLLPMLPDAGYGPGEAINPFKLWLLVVMVAGLSFIGYVTIKLVGARLGSLLTGVFGGLASSTALTVSFSRLGHSAPALQAMLSAGVAVAAAMMALRLLLIVAFLNDDLVPRLVWPLGMMAGAGFIGAIYTWRRSGRREHRPAASTPLSNPFEMGMALKFAAFLAAVLVLAEFARRWLGDAGLYALAAISGLADVDAISVSMANMAAEIGLGVAATGIVIAAIVNTLAKAAIVWGLCGGAMAWRISVLAALMVAAGFTGWMVQG